MRIFIYTFLNLCILCPCFAQESAEIKVEPVSLTMEVDEVQTIRAIVVDGQGNLIKDRDILYYGRKGITVDSLGNIKAHEPGEHKVIIISPAGEEDLIRKDYTVKVAFPPLAKVEIMEVPQNIYAGTSFQISTEVYDEKNFKRDAETVQLTSSDPDIVSFDKFHNLTAIKPGSCKIHAEVEGIESIMEVTVVSNPVVRLELKSDKLEARTGDVFHFEAIAFDKDENKIEDAPIIYSFEGHSYDVSSNASGLIKQDGRFVADEAGQYNILVTSGPFVARASVNIVARKVERKIELVGSGLVAEKHTSDLWIWEGVDGGDYAVTGTWGADGTAYFWDVTDPSNITRVDSIQVDARTVNDVKVSEDGKICIISREGASNRKNGIVILDVSNPREVEIISTFAENLTGGVHNLFIYKDHVFALSDGQKYYIINIEDPKNPVMVSKFELDTPGHAIHDVWVEDGIAYSSNWQDGVQMVDVGNGIAGGSPANPVQFASYKYPSGAHHATFPFTSPSTGKFYAVLGDEIFPHGLNMNGPNIAGGFLHFVDFTDLDNPEEIARFEVPGVGSHNYWIDDEILYVAFYNGGIRVVDISGELMGDLYKQGREMAFIIPSDPRGIHSEFTFYLGCPDS